MEAKSCLEGLGMWEGTLPEPDSSETHISCLDHPKAHYKTSPFKLSRQSSRRGCHAGGQTAVIVVRVTQDTGKDHSTAPEAPRNCSSWVPFCLH